MDLTQLLPDYDQMVAIDYVYGALWGMSGASLRIIANNSPFTWPDTTGYNGVQLNAFGELFAGAIVGALADHNPSVQVLAGLLSVQIAAILLDQRKTLAEVIRRTLRVVLGVAPEEDADG